MNESFTVYLHARARGAAFTELKSFSISLVHTRARARRYVVIMMERLSAMIYAYIRTREALQVLRTQFCVLTCFPLHTHIIAYLCSPPVL